MAERLWSMLARDRAEQVFEAWSSTLEERSTRFQDAWTQAGLDASEPDLDALPEALAFARSQMRFDHETPGGSPLPEWAVPGRMYPSDNPRVADELDVDSSWLADGFAPWFVLALLKGWPGSRLRLYRDEGPRGADNLHQNNWLVSCGEHWVMAMLPVQTAAMQRPDKDPLEVMQRAIRYNIEGSVRRLGSDGS